MEEIEIKLLGNQNQGQIEDAIETACAKQNLKLVTKGTLQKYPGCVHWHYQKEKTSGTLEITYWKSENRCWVPLRSGRAKPWVADTVKQLKQEIERKLSTSK
jgi:uncharacterized beta-barrel protein YwiB (DUF1934 family)